MADDSAAPSPGEDLLSIVTSGRRFIMIPYVFSIVVLSFKRSMGHVHIVREGEWPMRSVWAAAGITLLFGWLGPAGIIWSAIALFHLWRGGKDITLELLSHSVGTEEAKKIIESSPRPRPPASIGFLRLLIVVPLAALCLLAVCILFLPPWL